MDAFRQRVREQLVRETLEKAETTRNGFSIQVNSRSFDKYPAKQHAQRVAEKLGAQEGLIYLPGSQTRLLEDSDLFVTFRQRRYFYYITGCNEPDCYALYDIGADTLSLYIPENDLHKSIWNGAGPTIPEAYDRYDVDVVDQSRWITKHIEAWAKKNGGPIYILHGSQKPDVDVSKSLFDVKSLQTAMDLARVIKDTSEIELIRKANKITAEAHRAVLKNIRSYKNEAEVAGIFLDTCTSHGAPIQAYEIIAASGVNASTLHYVKNNESFGDRQLMCLDAGCEYECYASDVTRSFPLSGTWTKEAKAIYDLVQKMQDACVRRMGAGVRYLDLHTLAHKTAIQGLLDLGILHHGTVEEIYRAGTSFAFYPHGLGHHVGLDVHDVLFRDLLRPEQASTKSTQDCHPPFWQPMEHKAFLDTVSSQYGTILEENMVLTVEPGIYFSPVALETVYLPSPAHSKYINKEVLQHYLPVGGIRIEDNYLITSKGNECLSYAPKADEMIQIINGLPTEPTEEAPYCPIRGRLDLHTNVDTTEIKRIAKRRVASLQYAEHVRVLEERQGQMNKSLEHLANLQKTDYIRLRTLSQKHSNVPRMIPKEISTIARSHTLPKPPKNAYNALLSSDSPANPVRAAQETKEGSDPLFARRSGPELTLNTPPRDLEWHEGPTLFQNFDAPSLPPKLPAIPEKPVPYRSNTTVVPSTHGPANKPQSQPAPSALRRATSNLDVRAFSQDPPQSSITEKEPVYSQRRFQQPSHQFSNALLGHEAFFQARPAPSISENAFTRPILPSACTPSPYSHPKPQNFHANRDKTISGPWNQTIDRTSELPGPRTAAVIPLRNRQSMPVMPHHRPEQIRTEPPVRPPRPSSDLWEMPRETMFPPTIPTTLHHSNSTTALPSTRRTNPFRQFQVTRDTSPSMSDIHLGPALQSDTTPSRTNPGHRNLPPPPSDTIHRYSSTPRRRTHRYYPETRTYLGSPRPSPPPPPRPLQPWWLVQALGELKRRHPNAVFSEFWQPPVESDGMHMGDVGGWRIRCQCDRPCDAEGFNVGPGHTLDEFENHLWAVDHECRPAE